MQAEPIDDSGDAGLTVRLAVTRAEIEAAQRLRYRVFYEEMGAQPSADMAATKRDFDDFDDICDHLLVLDQRLGETDAAVVGTYRLQRRENPKFQGFYSAHEYDLAPIVGFPGRVLELGRSCVDAGYRTKMTMQLLWRGIAGYVFSQGIDVMFGCASLPGTDPQALAVPLSYLYHYHLAPPDLRPRALPGLYNAMDLMAKEAVDARRALAAVPPLIKGYLRLGGFVGDGAVIDRQFNTTDVCIIVKTELLTDKYFRHYDRTANRNI
ncbi:MAG TPA: GNAT family N-acetyltransferase [Rhodospirillaceae bacterium]|nr:GNAT family N-acetyltransferase [Rhodospirillaceae bacterium]